MCNWYEYLTKGQIARQIVKMILLAVQEGYLLPRKAKSIKKAIYFGTGHYLLDSSGWIVTCYTETIEMTSYFILRSVVVLPQFRKNGLFGKIVRTAIEAAWQKNPEKPVAFACHHKLVSKYEDLGFIRQEKANAPEEIRGSRSKEGWLACDREWMSLDFATYKQEKEAQNG